MNSLDRSPLAHTIQGACETTNLSRTTLYEAIKAKKLKVRKCGNRTLILHEDLKSFITKLPARSG
jgi:excisionase family DNA binding protein